MPSRSAISSAWSAEDRAKYRAEMRAKREALRACVKVRDNTIILDRSCYEKAVPKGTFENLWTD